MNVFTCIYIYIYYSALCTFTIFVLVLFGIYLSKRVFKRSVIKQSVSLYHSCYLSKCSAALHCLEITPSTGLRYSKVRWIYS